ncbi:MAG: hypothetical protein IK997_01595 [Bacilli bacterium]|nr:hypothetical protein [Bacilli bacterium]
MRIIEKKCPNCGAKLEFNVGDKETKCKYCNSGFIIEDNNTSEKKFSLDNINLKYIKNFTIIHMIITGVIMLLIVSTFIFIFYNIFKMTSTEKNNNSSNSFNFFEEVKKQKKKQEEKSKPKLKDISKELDEKLEKASKESDEEMPDYLITYKKVGESERIGYYYLKNSVSVKIIYVIKSTYTNGTDTKDIYKAFNFVGISIDSIGMTPFKNTKVNKLNQEELVYGYSSLEDLYNNAVSNQRIGYKIVATENLYMK